MRSDKTHAALLDIRENINAAWLFVEGLSLEQFRSSRLHFYAVTRALEIISEAARRLPSSLRDKHATLPWKQIMGVGNIYRHDYDSVQEIFVWATVQDHLASLLTVVTAEIEEFDGKS